MALQAVRVDLVTRPSKGDDPPFALARLIPESNAEAAVVHWIISCGLQPTEAFLSSIGEFSLNVPFRIEGDW